MKFNYTELVTRRKRGIWLFSETWFSICSQHHPTLAPKDDCPRCQAGHWVNDFRHSISSIIYENAPELWRWWANRKTSWSIK